jgi:hypothetical protein
MNTVYLRIFATGLAFILAACDNKSPASAKQAEPVIPVKEPALEERQTFKLNVDEALVKELKMSADEPVSLSESVKLKIKPVNDQQRLSVNGKLLLDETWQADYLDNIDGGKVELQLRFDD